MRPSCELILRNVANDLVMEYVNEVSTKKAKTGLGLTALLMGFVSEEFERGAARRIEENTELRKLFSKAVAVVQDESLRTRLKEASNSTDKDFRISSMDKTNCDLQELLIELHSHIETAEAEDARQVEKAIWAVLENWTRRREFMTTDLLPQMILMTALQEEGQ